MIKGFFVGMILAAISLFAATLLVMAYNYGERSPVLTGIFTT